jgi:hypothetical protein
MTLNQYVTNNYDNIRKWLFNITKGERPDLFEDFVHEVLVIFMEHNKAQEVVLQGDARWFIVRIGLNQWRSSTSPFHKEYRPRHSPLEFDIVDVDQYDLEHDIILELLMGILDDMQMGELEEYYMSMVVMVYFALDQNFSEMQRRLNIPRTSLSRVYTKAIDIIKDRLDQKIQGVKNGTINVIGNRDDVYMRWSELCSTAERKAYKVHLSSIESGWFGTI